MLKSPFSYKEYFNILEAGPRLGKKDPSTLAKKDTRSALARKTDKRRDAEKGEEQYRQDLAKQGGFIHLSQGIYSKQPDNPNATHYQWDSDMKNFVAIPPNDDRIANARNAYASPSTQPSTKSSITQPPVEKFNINASPQRLVTDLHKVIAAYKSGDMNIARTRMQKMVDFLHISQTQAGAIRGNNELTLLSRRFFGKLAQNTLNDVIPDNDPAREILGKLRNFSQLDFKNLAKELNVKIPIEGVDIAIPTMGQKNLFAPSNIQISLSTDPKGTLEFNNDQVKLTIKDPDGTDRILQTIDGISDKYDTNFKASRSYKNILTALENKGIPDDELEAQAELMYQNAFIFNQNLRHLSRLFRSDGGINGTIFEGGQGSAIRCAENIKSTLTNLDMQNFPPEFRDEIFGMIDQLSSLSGDNPDKFGKLSTALIDKLDTMDKIKIHIPAIVENLSIMEAAAKGYYVIIPSVADFPLADFIAIDKNKLKSFDSIDQYRILFEEDNPFIAGSVKKDKGGAASSFHRISLTAFKPYKNKFRTLSSANIYNDLMTIAGENGLMRQIFNSDNASYSESLLDSLLYSHYDQLIYEYYTSSDETSPSWSSMSESEQRIALTKIKDCMGKASDPINGKCNRSYPEHMSKGGCGHENKDRWVLYNIAGKVMEAIYNSTAKNQGFITHSYWLKKGRVVMDGKKVLSGMKFKARAGQSDGWPCTSTSNFPSSTFPINQS